MKMSWKNQVGIIFAIVVIAIAFNIMVDYNPEYKIVLSMWENPLLFLVPTIGFAYIALRLFDD